jgi:hypothetical protein
VPGRRNYPAVATDDDALSGTRRPASYGHPRCRERATCVPDPERCEPPDGKRGNSSVQDCGARSRAAHGSPADRTREGKKTFCCVTTRRRNFWLLTSLGRSLGPLAALALCLGMPGFGVSLLAMFGLPPRRLPSADLPPAFRLLTVALVPAPWLVLALAPLAQADPRARSAPSGRRAVFSLNVEGAHGRFDLPREKLGEDVSPSSSGAIETRTRLLPASLQPSQRTRQRTKRF